MANTTSGSTTSVRFQRLQECIHAALKKSHSRIDIEQAVRQVYGDDGNNDVFQSLLDGMLTKMHADVTIDMSRFLKGKKVEEKLTLLEAVISKLEREAAVKVRAAKADKESTERALRSTTLPLNVTAQDFVRFQAYRRMQKEKDSLRDKVDALENEIAKLEKDQSRNEENVESGVSEMLTFKGDLEKTADICSALS